MIYVVAYTSCKVLPGSYLRKAGLSVVNIDEYRDGFVLSFSAGHALALDVTDSLINAVYGGALKLFEYAFQTDSGRLYGYRYKSDTRSKLTDEEVDDVVAAVAYLEYTTPFMFVVDMAVNP